MEVYYKFDVDAMKETVLNLTAVLFIWWQHFIGLKSYKEYSCKT